MVNKFVGPNDRLYSARMQRGWSQQELATLVGLLDKKSIGRWERGTSFPQPHYRQELCRVFEMNMEELGLLKQRSDLATHDQKIESPSRILGTAAIWKIPSPFTSFIGRDQEINDASTILRRPEVRLLTVLGPGGVGKTRLVVEVAKEMRSDFPDGTCFVSLSAIQDAAFVLPTIAKELCVQESGEGELADDLCNFLREKQFLLIIDNFEHILQARPLLEKLLEDCSHLKIVVTSRAVLYLQAEYEFSLAPLSIPDPDIPTQDMLSYASIQLFIRRTQARIAAFQPTQDGLLIIREICSFLDGLPLAIELAAARTKIFPLPELLQAISQQPLRILKSEQRTLPLRQTTLFGTIEWSYKLLNEQEQWLFRYLAVFSGGFVLAAIEKICRLYTLQSLDSLDILTSLLDKSIIQRSTQHEEIAFFTILETIREYGIYMLKEKGEWKAARQIHAEYYASQLEEASFHLRGARQGFWLTSFDRERENLHAAFAWLIDQKETERALCFCETLGKYCGLRGYWSEEQHLLEIVLSASEANLPTAMLGRVLRRAGHLAYRFRDLAKAQVLLERSVAVSRALKDQQNLAGALSGLGWVLYRRKEIFAAEQLLQESVEVARDSEDKWTLANTLESLGRFFHYQGFLDKSSSFLQESIALARVVADQENLARILSSYVALEITQGNLQQAVASAQESFSLASTLGNKPLIALGLDSLANVSFFQQEYEQATKLYEARIQISYELGDTPAIVVVKLRLSDIALRQGDLEQGMNLVQECLQFFRLREDNPNVAFALCILGDIQRAKKNFRQALNWYKDALILEKAIGETRNICRCLTGAAQIMIQHNFNEQAVYLLAFIDKLQSVNRENPLLLFSVDYKLALERVQALMERKTFMALWSSGTQKTHSDIIEICGSIYVP